MTIQRVSNRSGIGGGRLPPVPSHGGGGGGEGEKVFFDDGQVKVTESLVVIGPPWNKAFGVSQIRGVTYGKNRSMELADAVTRLVGMMMIFAGGVSLVAGFLAGFFAGVLTGIGIIWIRAQPDVPFCVTLDFGNAWAQEYLTTANEAWAQALAIAVAAAIRSHRKEGGVVMFPEPKNLRN